MESVFEQSSFLSENRSVCFSHSLQCCQVFPSGSARISDGLRNLATVDMIVPMRVRLRNATKSNANREKRTQDISQGGESGIPAVGGLLVLSPPWVR